VYTQLILTGYLHSLANSPTETYENCWSGIITALELRKQL